MAGRRERKGEPARLERPTLAAALLDRLVGKATRRQGFADPRLVTDWVDVVGAEIAADTMPLELNRRARVLTVKVRPAAALVLQHEEPLVLERINAFFGTTVANRLRLVQGVIARAPQPVPPPELADHEHARIDASVAGIENERLRRALADLGTAVHRRRKALARAPTAPPS